MLTSPLLAISRAPSQRRRLTQQRGRPLFSPLQLSASHNSPQFRRIPCEARDTTLALLLGASIHTVERLPPSRRVSPAHFQTHSVRGVSLPSKSFGNAKAHALRRHL